MMCENGSIQKTYELNGNASLCDSFCQHHQLHKCRFKIPKVNIYQLLKWKETAFMKISSNFRAVIKDFVRSDSFFLSFLKAWKVTITAKAWLWKQPMAWLLSESGFSHTIRKELGKKRKKIFYSPSFFSFMFLKFPQIFLQGKLLFLTLFHIFLSGSLIPCCIIPGRAGIREF